MPYLTAHALDRFNEQLVRWRLGGRLAGPGGAPVADYLRDLGDVVHPPPTDDLLKRFTPTAAGTLWKAESPWPCASGNNCDWYAERVEGTTGDAEPRPALILLHGWLADRPQLMVYRSWARRVAARGIDVWMPRLPYHLERAEPGEVSGQRCLSPDLTTSLDAVRQATLEARLLASWLRARGAPRVGIWGMSLGGWVAALSSTLDDHWDAVVLWAPVASPAEVLFESPLVEILRRAIVRDGVSPETFAAPEFAAITPARRRTLVARSKVLVVAAAYDRVIAPPSIARLARRWNVDVRWVPHGHISLMAARVPVRDTAAFLHRHLV